MARGRAIGLFCSCAMFVSCTNLVRITSKPTGARVRIDGVAVGRTPLSTRVTWWPWRYNQITLEHPGYHPFSTNLRRTFRFPDPPADWDKNNWDSCIGGSAFAGVYGPLGLVEAGAGAGVLAIPALTIGAFRGPVNNQHFVLAPRSSEARLSAGRQVSPLDRAIPAPPVSRPVPPEWRFSAGLGAGVYASDPSGDYVGRISLEARKGRHAAIISGGPEETRIVDIEEPDGSCELEQLIRLVYRGYAGAGGPASEWFWEVGLAYLDAQACNMTGSPPDWSLETVHLAAGIGMRVEWSQGRPASFSEFHLNVSAGQELQAPSGFLYCDRLHLESPHVQLGAVVIGVSF